jgi:hypothetical protein
VGIRSIAGLVILAASLAACSSSKPAPAAPAASGAATPASAGKKAPEAAGNVGLGFVLLDKAELPAAAAVMEQYARLAPDGPPLTTPETKDDIHSFKHGEVFASVALMPRAIPGGEADDHARFSVMAIAKKWTLPPHTAHLMVMTMNAGASPLERARTAHRLIAAATAAAGPNAVGVYVGDGGVTHPADFYIDVVGDEADAIVAWSGVSFGRSGERLSFLSTGMGQLGLPDVELAFQSTQPADALAALYDIMLYVARRGTALPEGDTVGQTAAQRVQVHYVASPVDPAIKVMRLDYP